MAAEVAPRELGERGIAARTGIGAGAIVEQHVGLLLAAPRAAADQLLELGVPEHVPEADRVALDPRGREGRDQLLARPRLRARELAGEHPVAPLERRTVEARPLVPVLVRLMDPRRGQPQQPADVLGGDEVPGRAHHVRADDLAVRERPLDLGVGGRSGDPLGERPLDLGELLGLDGARPAHRVGHRPERLAGEPLARVAAPDRRQRVQPARRGSGRRPGRRRPPRCSRPPRPSRSAARARSPRRPAGRGGRDR